MGVRPILANVYIYKYFGDGLVGGAPLQPK